MFSNAYKNILILYTWDEWIGLNLIKLNWIEIEFGLAYTALLMFFYSNKLKLDWILITFLAVVAMSSIQYTL